MTEFDELVKASKVNTVARIVYDKSGGILVDVEVEELKRRVEELERRLMGVCPGPYRCPYVVDRRTNVGDTGDHRIYPWEITHYY